LLKDNIPPWSKHVTYRRSYLYAISVLMNDSTSLKCQSACII
jgi:hypothetical protein